MVYHLRIYPFRPFNILHSTPLNAIGVDSFTINRTLFIVNLLLYDIIIQVQEMARNKNMGFLSENSILVVVLVILVLFFFLYLVHVIFTPLYRTTKESFEEKEKETETETDAKTSTLDYLKILEADKNKRNFPFRYFQDKSGNILPFAAVSAFFRDERTKKKYFEYIKNGIHVFGITAYKTFPKKIADGTGDNDTKNDTFDYLGNIKNWLTCFRDPEEYGFTSNHNIIEMSESDFYDANTEANPPVEKKYDFIYSCLKDDDRCPLDGWNAVNRNFRLAKECFKIMIKEYGLKGLIVGRIGCGLEEEFGDKVEVTDMLDYHIFQQKLAQSRFLFVPNVYDASPRVIAEALIKDVPVLMNRNIVCGSKYVKPETGEFFKDEYDIRLSLDALLGKMNTISPKKWWKAHYSTDES